MYDFIQINKLYSDVISESNIHSSHVNLRIYNFGKFNDYDNKCERITTETFYLLPQNKIKIFTGCFCNVPLIISSRIECVLKDDLRVLGENQIYIPDNKNEISFILKNESNKPILLKRNYKVSKATLYIPERKIQWSIE